MKRAALISVSDKRGCVEFAQGLRDLGLTLLTTSGSKKFLAESGIDSLGIEEYTGQKEILDGRVKTLHPRIHAGLLARTDNPEHVRQLEEDDILQITVAVVNLYPFLEKLKTEAANDLAAMTEFIDIGGPTMIRAAAKNHRSVLPVIDPSDYEHVLSFLRTGSAKGMAEAQFRLSLASRVFTAIAEYDLAIARYMAAAAEGVAFSSLGPIAGTLLSKEQELRYGENPHQRGGFYRAFGQGKPSWQQINGKELSYNNFLDTDAALRIVSSLSDTKPAAVIVKHANPCGVAIADTIEEALSRAKRCDPRSHFGGILAFNRPVTKALADLVREDFAEVVIASEIEPDAVPVLATSKNLRVLRIGTQSLPTVEVRTALDGILLQEPDREISSVDAAKVVSSRAPSDRERADLDLAWRICAHVKSNAIVIAKEGMVIGVGAGQMSRIDSVELAIKKASVHGHDLKGAVVASDAFFPFTDNVETLAKSGISAIIVPSGAKRDDEVIAAANQAGVALLFVADRHFRH